MKSSNNSILDNKASRKWLLTINNPDDKGLNHNTLKSILSSLSGKGFYWCMCDEIGGKDKTYHTHLFLYRDCQWTFERIKKAFPKAHIDKAYGTTQQNRDYIRKEGNYENSEKALTNLKDTFEESGDCPEEKQGARNDLAQLYSMIKDGCSNYEILESNANYIRQLDKLDRIRETLRFEEYKNKCRDVKVEYFFGSTGSGKTSSIFDTYGFDNVYRVTDIKHPFDSYRGQDVIVFEEFYSANYQISDLLNWLDRYPVELPCRYMNKVACYTKVFFTSNISLTLQYTSLQKEVPETWKAFLRRINCIRRFNDDKSVDIFNSYDELINEDKPFRSLTYFEQRELPF